MSLSDSVLVGAAIGTMVLAAIDGRRRRELRRWFAERRADADRDALIVVVMRAGHYSRELAGRMVDVYLHPPELPSIEEAMYLAIVRDLTERSARGA